MSPQQPRSGSGGPRRGVAVAAAAEAGPVGPAARRPPRGSAPQRRSGSAPGGGGSQRSGGPQRGSSGTTKPSQPTRLPERREPQGPPVDVHDPDGVRLQKLLAAAGVGSRRVCENLIAAGRVEVDGHVVTELGVRIDPDRQAVHVDGIRVQLDESRLYLAFNKPLGVVSTMSDDLGRPSVGDYVRNRKERLFHVGRLDADTEGLLLLTNDGELAHRLHAPVVRRAQDLPGPDPGPGAARPRQDGCATGIELEDGPVKVDSFRVVDSAARQGAGRGGAARGPQARRPPPAGGRGPPGDHAGAHRRRPDPPRRRCARARCARSPGPRSAG